MKRVVFLDDLKEADIRPEKSYEEYKLLLAKDIGKYFADASRLKAIDCPGCGNKGTDAAFGKMNFTYRSCVQCGTLFVSPRPDEEALANFYEKSEAGRFLRRNFLGDTIESRSEKIFSSRVQWIIGLMEEYLPGSRVYMDYATKYPVFLKQIHNARLFQDIFSASPECFEQENMLLKDIHIVKGQEAKEGSVDIFSAFEVVERVFSPQKLFQLANTLCRDKGLFVVTTTTSSGFEYQVLGEHSPNIIPIDRLNLLSLEALTGQIEKAGFEIIEISTPGRLDVEIVKKTFEKNPAISLHPFWQYLFRNRDEGAMHSLQEYLQQYQLSSHVRIAAIKK